MEETNKSNVAASLCKSVFKNGEVTTALQFTLKWAELINLLEKERQPLSRQLK